MERRSLSFDPAVEDYDRTRGLTPEVMAHVVRILTAELSGRGLALEIGVGTGRIALPLAGAGAPLVGIDLSHKMLGRLVEKAGGTSTVPVARADATALPFRDSSFDAALAVHVLHLIDPWREAVGELLRVVRPGGILLVDPGDWKRNVHRELDEAFCRAAGIEHRRPGINSIEELDDHLIDAGARPRPLEPITDTQTDTLDARIRRLEDGIYSFTWDAEAETRAEAGRVVREWAEKNYGALDEPREFSWTVAWRAYDLP